MKRLRSSWAVVALATVFMVPTWVDRCHADFVRGDVTGDGFAGLVDAIEILLYVANVGPAPLCFDAADSNDSGEVNVVDAMHTLSHAFLSAAPPPFPFPACGDDPTPDALDCVFAANCP